MGESYQGVPRKEIPWFPNVDLEKCARCGSCAEECPNNVYDFDEAPIVARPYNCAVGCSSCAKGCPSEAITFPTLKELQTVLNDLRVKYGKKGQDRTDRKIPAAKQERR